MNDDGARWLSRRNFMGAAALGLASPAMTYASLSAKKPSRNPGIIDVHHHIVAPTLSEFTRNVSWSPHATVEDMDRAGIAAGIGWPGPVLIPELGRRAALARSANEFGAGLGRDFPGRFGLFASLPFPDTAAVLAEVDYALDQLHADGFGVASSYDGKWLGDQAFWPIWEKMNARDAVIFVHPQDTACCTPATMGYAHPQPSGVTITGSWIDWPMNTARTILSLMTTGALRRFPRIRFIFAHGGGVMPLLVQRIAGFRDWSQVGPAGLATYFPDGIAAEFRTLHFECAQAYARPNIDALRNLVPDSHLLFGSDYPAFPLAHASEQFAALKLPSATRDAIARDNAAALLPRWA